MKLDRRAVLRGAGGVAIGLPWLEIMGCTPGPGGSATSSSAQRVSSAPKRFIAVYTPNGTVLDQWTPTGTETQFTLPNILAPLEPFRSKLLVLDGLTLVASREGPGDPHQRGMAWLTGQGLATGDQVGNDGVSRAGYANGISLDQAIAKTVGVSTKFRSLEFGVQLGGADVMHRMSYLGASQPVPPEEDPSAAFGRIFADVNAGADSARQVAARRATVLDAVGDDYTRLMKKLGAEDRRKIEQHLASIREIESRLSQSGTVGGTCAPVPPRESYSTENFDEFPVVGKLQMDVLVMALACDMTRVASLLWSGAKNRHTFNWLNIADEHHTLSHTGSSDTASQTKLARIHRWYSEQFAYLLGRLEAIPEGDGTLLDNTAILWGTDVALGNAHSEAPIPFLVAGGAQKALRTGRYLKFPEGTPHSNLLVSMLNAMNVDAGTFGKPDACTGPLSGLT
jgi:hypothetical protein